MNAWKSGDKFEVRDRDKTYLFVFGRVGSGAWLAMNDELNITVQGDDFAACREAALEAVRLIREDIEVEG